MQKRKKAKHNTKSHRSEITRRQFENIFIAELFKYLAEDLAVLYSRKTDFLNGKSMNYCRIGKLKFSDNQNITEMRLNSTAFKLGVEFGVNISIDAFTALMKDIFEQKSGARVTKEKLNIQELLKKSNMRRKVLLHNDLFERLRNTGKNSKK
jgi:hypothetical protein